jgi:alpha-ribazole phosphatase
MIHNIYLIRHAKTQGNFEGRYVGLTNEPLCDAGIKMLMEKIKAAYYPKVDCVYVSPMKRCLQTTEKIYPGVPLRVVAGFAEYNFGEFERKNYQELKDNFNYQQWIDSGGAAKTPGGEDIESYKRRCCQAFEQVMAEVRQKNISHAALIIHGGTIMAIMEKYISGAETFYHWQIGNCEGYRLTVADGKVKTWTNM